MPTRIDSLPATELKALLELDADLLPDPVREELDDFLARIGGLENAILAAELLDRLEGPPLPRRAAG